VFVSVCSVCSVCSCALCDTWVTDLTGMLAGMKDYCYLAITNGRSGYV
jgi:hypothetical protein